MADELDDGLLLDEGLVAHSDGEGAGLKGANGESPSVRDKAAEDATAEKKRKRRERQKAQRRKVRSTAGIR